MLCIENVAAFVFIPTVTTPPHTNIPTHPKTICFFPRFRFFVKIHLIESSKLNLLDLYVRNYSLMILFRGNVDSNKNYMLYT